MKIDRTCAETKRLTARPTIFMPGGAPTAHDFLPDKFVPVPTLSVRESRPTTFIVSVSLENTSVVI